MRLEIRQRNAKITDGLHRYVEERLHLALGRFARHIQRVRVYLRDVNGPRGGLDKKCRIVVELPLRARVVVTGIDRLLSAAIAQTANRAGLALKRHLQRGRASRRPPRRIIPLTREHQTGSTERKGETHHALSGFGL